MRKDKKAINKIRVNKLMRLKSLLEAFFDYQLIELNKSLMEQDRSYSDSENTRDMIQMFCPNREFNVEEFIYSDNELSDQIIDASKRLQERFKELEHFGITKEQVLKFCHEAMYNIPL